MHNTDQINTTSNANIAALDGVRALAVALVMAVHYHEKFGGGWIGVQLFFVLSGFLITRILLNAKTTAAGMPDFLKVFWIRRALRIFPLYVLFLLIGETLWWMTASPVTWPVARPWLWTYSLNFGHMLGLVPISDVYSHFWSLAVEEQFYLLWPLLIWFLSRKALGYLVICILLFAPMLRYALVESGVVTTYQLYFLTPTLFDAFATGAALVLFDWQWIKQVRWWLLGMVSVTIMAGMLANLQDGLHFSLWSLGYPYFMPHALQYAWGYTLLNITAALLLLACMRNELAVFSNRHVAGLGKISYGIYIIHRPVYRMITAAQPHLAGHIAPLLLHALNVLFFVAGTLLMAKLSYRYFETPFLRLKRYFEYSAAHE
ncbi:MAG: acyltransferase [Steroidobacter sp.]